MCLSIGNQTPTPYFWHGTNGHKISFQSNIPLITFIKLLCTHRTFKRLKHVHLLVIEPYFLLQTNIHQRLNNQTNGSITKDFTVVTFWATQSVVERSVSAASSHDASLCISLLWSLIMRLPLPSLLLSLK